MPGILEEIKNSIENGVLVIIPAEKSNILCYKEADYISVVLTNNNTEQEIKALQDAIKKHENEKAPSAIEASMLEELKQKLLFLTSTERKEYDYNKVEKALINEIRKHGINKMLSNLDILKRVKFASEIEKLTGKKNS